MAKTEARYCASCGRVMTPRKRWARTWEQVRYCSGGCRRRRVTATDRALEHSILDLLDSRARGATICPSEAARRVAPSGWRDLMAASRCAARRLAARGRLEIVQGGRIVDPSAARGPIRLRRPTLNNVG